MNQQQRQAYSEKHIRRIKKFEQVYTRRVYDVLHASMKDAAQAVRTGSIQGYLNNLVMLPIGPVIQQLYVNVGLWAAKRTKREIARSVREVKGFGNDPQWIANIIEYFRLHLLNKAVLPITQTQREHIMTVLTNGEQQGWGVDKMAFEIENSGLTVSRARMIVRTEISKAQFQGTKLGREDSEFETTKQWISATDHRTRHSHREVDGETIDVNGRFNVNRYKGKMLIGVDMMEGPGDPEASAENVIQCRCTTAERAKRDEQGRLIRKRRVSVIMPGQFVRREPVITV